MKNCDSLCCTPATYKITSIISQLKKKKILLYYYTPIGMAKKKNNTQNRKQKIILRADKAAEYEYT